MNDVEYDTIEKVWYDVGSQFPKKWNEDDGEPLYDVWPTTPNLPIQFWYNDNDSLQFQFDNPYYVPPSIVTDAPILTQVGETYTIQVVGNNLESEGWYYSINGASFNFTTDNIQTRSFTVSQTVTVTVQGTSGSEFSASINLIVPYYQIIEPTGGDWNGLYQYHYIETTSEGRWLYSLVDEGTTNVVNSVYDVEYDPSDKTWHSLGGDPYAWAKDTDGGGMSSLSEFPTDTNIQTHYWYDENLYFKIQFTDPYYVAPEPEAVVEPDENQKRIVATGGQWQGIHDYSISKLYRKDNPRDDFYIIWLILVLQISTLDMI